MIWGKIKSYAVAILAVLAGVFGIAAKIFMGRAQEQKQRADAADAKHEHAVDVLENDIQVDKELEEKKEELKDEVKKTGTSSELSNPNDW